MAARDTSPEAEAIQLEAYRRMSPAARLRAGLELTAMSRKLLSDGIRRRHPGYSEEQVHLALLRLWLGPDLFGKAYPTQPELDP